MKKEKKEPETKMGKLMWFINEMETFLHPRVGEALKKYVWDARTEMAQEAKDQVFSKEMQILEQLLEKYRADIRLFYRGGYNGRLLWHMRPLLKKIIELYGADSDH